MRALRSFVFGAALALSVALIGPVHEPLQARQNGQAIPTFRSSVDLVQLSVVVLDKQERPVPGLTAADFTVIEDDRVEPLQAFAPITLAPSPRVRTPGAETAQRSIGDGSDVTSNQQSDQGRLVVIVLDRTIDIGQPSIQAREIAHAIVDALGPQDLAAVVRTTGFSGEGGQQNFTDDHQRLHQVLDDPFIGLTRPPEMNAGALIRSGNDGLALQVGECPSGLCVLQRLADVAHAMEHDARRQKVIFFIGTQMAFQETDIDPAGQTPGERERVLDALAKSDVTVHVLDPRGLETLTKNAAAFAPDANVAIRVRDNLARQSALGVLPAFTGGRTVLNTNAPETWVPALLDQSRIYYLLAFARPPAADGRFHHVKVIVNRPGVTVRTRSGYFGSAPDVPAEPLADPATQATRGLLPLGDIPLSLVAMPVFDDGLVRAAVGIAIPSNLSAPASDDRFDVVVQALDSHAQVVSSQGMTLTRSTDLKGDRLQQSIRVPVRPGRYEIRVGVLAASGVSASVYGNVDVPDIAKQDVALSGAVFLPVPDDVPMVPMLLIPSVTRVFDRTSPTSAYWQVFRRGGQSVHITATIRNDTNRTIVRTEQALDDGEKDAALITTHRLKLPKPLMRAGKYVLELTASNGRARDRREIAFEVR